MQLPRFPYPKLKTTACVLLGLVASATLGCAPKSDMGAVRGKVTIDGQPLPTGQIVTLPSAGRGSHGVIKDGEFQLTTVKENDGAVPGTHKVAIVAREPSQGIGPEATVGKSLIPQRYSDPNASGLTIEVKAGETNTPTLKLTSP